jgi:hypothetical protein
MATDMEEMMSKMQSDLQGHIEEFAAAFVKRTHLDPTKVVMKISHDIDPNGGIRQQISFEPKGELSAYSSFDSVEESPTDPKIIVRRLERNLFWMRNAKPEGNDPIRGRYYAVSITQLEIAIAYFKTYITDIEVVTKGQPDASE